MYCLVVCRSKLSRTDTNSYNTNKIKHSNTYTKIYMYIQMCHKRKPQNNFNMMTAYSNDKRRAETNVDIFTLLSVTVHITYDHSVY